MDVMRKGSRIFHSVREVRLSGKRRRRRRKRRNKRRNKRSKSSISPRICRTKGQILKLLSVLLRLLFLLVTGCGGN